MAVAGFFSVIVTILTMLMKELNLFPALGSLFDIELGVEEVDMLVEQIFSLAYLTIIFPVLGSGLAIWANSVAIAYKRRDWSSIGIGAYNTYAQAHNVINAFRNVPRATKSLTDGISFRFKAKDGKAIAYLLILLFPIVISLGLAILVTVLIMRASDARYDLDELMKE